MRVLWRRISSDRGGQGGFYAGGQSRVYAGGQGGPYPLLVRVDSTAVVNHAKWVEPNVESAEKISFVQKPGNDGKE